MRVNKSLTAKTRILAVLASDDKKRRETTIEMRSDGKILTEEDPPLTLATLRERTRLSHDEFDAALNALMASGRITLSLHKEQHDHRREAARVERSVIRTLRARGLWPSEDHPHCTQLEEIVEGYSYHISADELLNLLNTTSDQPQFRGKGTALQAILAGDKKVISALWGNFV